MDPLVKDMYIALCARPNSPKEWARMISLVQDIIASDEGFEFVQKYCTRAGNYLYGEYMKEKTKRIYGKVNSDGGIVI